MTFERATVFNTYIELSSTAYHNGHFDVAESMLKAAYKEMPKDQNFKSLGQVLENLAEVFVAQKRYVKSERLYRRALAMYQQHSRDGQNHAVRIYCRIAHANALQKKFEAAEKWAQKALELATLTSEHGPIIKLIGCYHEMDEHDRAWEIYRQLLKIRFDASPEK
ncbi:MAG: tetratricopeptide repeat protein [Terriglobales bacterium]